MSAAASLATASAGRMAQAIRDGDVRAVDLLAQVQSRLDRFDPAVNAFTARCDERALREAERVDRDRAQGRSLPSLAGVPFGVKNLFDVAGMTTVAGSKILRDQPPAARDATLVERLCGQGAVLVGAQNMDEFAYGFTTENAHYGPARNPHDLQRSAGGSSGGSAAAVAAGLVPLSLGSDTNGSIRVPSSLCGIFGLKPTFGRLSRRGSYPFVSSLDHLGPFARCTADLALAYDAMLGPDPEDPCCAVREPEKVSGCIESGVAGLRVAVAGGYFEELASPATRQAVAQAAQALGAGRRVDVPEAVRARAAAFLISNVEGAQLHLAHLRERFDDMEPASRERFMAGALVPGQWYVSAQRFRRWFHDAMLALFADIDVILAPATPRSALPLGQLTFDLNGVEQMTRPAMGLLTQPISFIGWPVAVVPLPGAGDDGLPIGVQIIAPPWREDLCLRVARALEQAGVARADLPPAFV